MAVDLPAPFSPTMAWMVPAATVISTLSLATTAPNRFVIWRSSSITGTIASVTVIRPAMIRFPRVLGGVDRGGRQQALVELVDRVRDAITIQAEDMKAGTKRVVHDILHDLIHRVVDPLHHTGQHEARLTAF